MNYIKPAFRLFLFLPMLIGCSLSDKRDRYLPLRIPGEFEKQQAIWLGFRTSESELEEEKDTLTLQIAKALSQYIVLNLIIEHDSLLPEGKAFFLQWNIDTSKIKIVVQSPTDIWYRDPGPIFGITPHNRLAIADFKYTNYTNVPPDSISEVAKEHEGIDRNIAERLEIPSIPSIVALEGGAFETNGRGELIQCEALTLGRNPHLTKKEIELDFQKNYGIHKIIWLPSGLVEDPLNMKRIYQDYWGFGTGGHTDEFVRFANDTTILLAWIEENERDEHWLHEMNHEVLVANYEILANSVNLEGRKYHIVKIPVPEPHISEEILDSTYWTQEFLEYQQLKHHDTIKWVVASSYLNYILSNDIVIIPAYWKSGESLTVKKKDQNVKEIFSELYPNRRILQMDPTLFNFQGGGMHCRYQSEPKI